MKHLLHHLLGCGLPILLLFLLPAFGVSAGVTFTLFFVLMFACHLFMMRGHGAEEGGRLPHGSEGNERR